MSQASPDSSIGVGRYLTALRRRWHIVVICTVVGAVAAGLVLALAPTTATATTTVNMNVISTDPFGSNRSASGLLDLSTEEAVAGSAVVAANASELLDGRQSAARLRAGTEIATTDQATVLRVSYTASSPEEAREGADAIADAYLTYRGEVARQRLESMLERNNARLEVLRPELVDANVRFAAAEAGSSESVQADSDRQLITAEIDKLLVQSSELGRVDTSGGSVLSPASGNGVTYSPDAAVLLAGGIFVGLAVGLVAAVAGHGRRIRDRDGLVESTRAPVLGEVTTSDVQGLPTDEEMNAFREARERIFARSGAPRSIAVLDATGRAGQLDVPTGLALAMAEDGTDIELVPTSPEEMDAVRASLSHGPRMTGLAGTVRVPTSGAAGGEAPSEAAVTALAHRTGPAREAGVTLVAVSSGAPIASCLAVARLADAVVVVAERGRTSTSALTRFVGQMREVDAPIVGSILVARRPARDRGVDPTAPAPGETAAPAEPVGEQPTPAVLGPAR